MTPLRRFLCIILPRILVCSLLCAGVVTALSSAMAQEAQQPYAWQVGPVDVKLGDQAVLKLPDGYQSLDPADTQRALKAMGNFPSGEELALVASSKGTDAENWFVVIRFQDTGYVKDDDAKNWDADALLADIKAGTEEANTKRKQLGIPSLIIGGWEQKPTYDQAGNKVVWAISAFEEGKGGVNYNTLALGRHGYLSMNMVGPLEELPKLKPHTQNLLANLTFVEGKRYVDFNSATDKVAAVGLAALIAGAAAKTGLLAKLWALIVPLVIAGKKLIVLLVIGVGALVARIWKKRRSGPSEA
ncbi:MAG: DUF2167 domain-containing protein [Nitrospiraceae bacterium]